MAQRNQGNCSVRYSKNTNKIYLLLNIYINTVISDLRSKCFVSQSNNSLWLRPPSSVVRPTAQAASCSLPQITIPASQGSVQLHVSCPPL